MLDPLQIEEKASTYTIKAPREGKRPRIHTLESRHSHPYDKNKMIKTHRQFSVHPLLDLCGEAAPSDARYIVGVTMEDLYSDTTDSFTVGMASGPLCGVAIFSFARYDPLFEKNHTTLGKSENTKKKRRTGGDSKTEGRKEEVVDDHDRVFLERSCKVLAHEIGHMFGIAHCTYYECLMNGSGHLEEDFRQPLHLCPVDLRKLLVALGANALERYKELLAFYTKVGFENERKWMQERIQFLEKSTV